MKRAVLVLLMALALGGCMEWWESVTGVDRGYRIEGPPCPRLQEVADSVDLAHQGYANFKDKRCEGIDWNEEEWK